jgi:MSHA pilin protein MshD
MCIRNRKPAALRQAGLTMVELVIFIVVVSIGVVGVLQVLNLTTKSSADPQLRKQALAIAEGLLEEVQLARFTFCDPADAKADIATAPGDCASAVTTEVRGPEAGNVRPFDNVNDYVTTADAWGTAQSAFNDLVGNLVDAAGNSISATGTYTATLTITPETLNGVTSAIVGADMAQINALRITVTVNYANESLTLEGYRTRYAPNSVP